MSILIKGMEMPKEGYRTVEIAFDADGHPMALADGGDVFDVIPVSPHGRLGDLDKLEQMFSDIDHAPYSGFDGSEPFYSAEDAAQIIRLAPTIIPAEEGE